MKITYAKTFCSEYTTLNISWDELIETLQKSSFVPRIAEHKDFTECLGTFILKSGETTRTIDTVAKMSDIAMFDLDAPGWDQGRIANKLKGMKYALYTTTNSRLHHQRWRILVKLDREYENFEHESVWSYFNEIFENELDDKTQDITRLAFFPHRWRHAFNRFINRNGDEYSVGKILAAKPPAKPILNGKLTLKPKRVIKTVVADHFKLIEPWMIDNYLAGKRGLKCGRLFYLLINAAGRAYRWGKDLTADELAAAVYEAHPSIRYDARGRVRTLAKITREAGRAIEAIKNTPFIEKDAKPIDIGSTLQTFKKNIENIQARNTAHA